MFRWLAVLAAGVAVASALSPQWRSENGRRPSRQRPPPPRRHDREYPHRRKSSGIEPETVRSYLLLQQGDAWDTERIDRSLKALFATGLFADVKLTLEGNTWLFGRLRTRSSTALPLREIPRLPTRI